MSRLDLRIERWWRAARLRMRFLLRRARVEQELEDELQYHLEQKIEQGMARGLSAGEARCAAVRAMDGMTLRKEEMRDMRRIHWLADLAGDVRYAARSLRRSPGLTAFVVVTLALGIGMTSTTFSMMDGLIFRPYPVPQAGRVVNLVSTSKDSAYEGFSYREYLDLRADAHSYEGVVASGNIGPVGFSAEAGTTPRVKRGMLVSGNYFQVLGVEPRLGRGFREDEDRVPGRDAVTVLSAEFWKQEFGGDAGAIGRTVRLNGREFTVIGVAPESFTGMELFAHPDLYLPLAMARVMAANPRRDFFEDREDRELMVRGRLKAGATARQARSEAALLGQNFERAYPQASRNRGAAVRTQIEMQTRAEAGPWKFMVIFSILALAVLLVACSNVAGLLLSRGRTRTREVAVRLALGAGRFRLLRLLLTESAMLAALGGLGGVATGYVAIGWLSRFRIPSELPVTVPFQMDARVVAVSLALAALSALLCGLAPALQSTRTDLLHGLKTADADLPGRKRLWGRNVLVVAQVSISLMLLAAALLMVRGFRQSLTDGTGFLKDHLLMARFDPRLVQYDDAQTQRFYRQLLERARGLAGVRSAALLQNPPLGVEAFGSLAFVPDGMALPRDRQNFTARMDTVSEGYFETIGVPIVRGRGFVWSDNAEAPRVAVVNEHFAEHYWPGGDAVGKQIRLNRAGGEAVEIVGVARTIKYQSTMERPMDFVYLPLAQRPTPRMMLLLRASGDPLELVKPAKELVRSLDANMPLLQLRSYEELYRYNAVEGPGVAIELVGTMGAVGLLLAMAGLYGLVAYNVSRRTREIGIRMAIGATPRDVLRLVMGKGLTLVGVGTVLGVALGFAVERLLNAMLFNNGGVDLLVYAAVTPSLIAVTMLAAYIPARKAARIAPTTALRYE